jgi:serine protease Do
MQNAKGKMGIFCILYFALIILHFALLLPARAQEGKSGSLPAREEAAFLAAVDKVSPSIVQIRTIGGLESVDDTILPSGPTTGLVISADGFVLSSAFNFVQQPASILMSLPSGKQAAAELVATDHSRMLVLLKLNDVSGLPVPELAPVGDVRRGAWAIAIGRTFRPDRPNVSIGIVSALGRMHGKVVQTDAAVSTANYGGPLVDIHGRVIGLLVPMAPQSTSEVAGVEWYDSGIGFAVPLSTMGEAIERMKRGDDQHAGILGISLAGRRPLTSPPTLAAVRPDSPAGKAGLKKDDRIVEVDGRPIQTQNDLRRALGPRYAGESVRVVAMRGEDRLERTLTLAGKLPPFRHAFLGILPMRAAHNAAAESEDEQNEPTESENAKTQDEPAGEADATAKGVTVRMVYPGSPAAEGGIQAGDRLIKINESIVSGSRSAIEELNNVAPETEVTVEYLRGDETNQATLTAVRLPTNVLSELPPAYESSQDGNVAAPAPGETRDLKLAEMPQTCKVYVPAAHAAGRPMGVLLWLHPPGESKPDEVIRQWQPVCDRDGLVLVVPTAENVQQWERTEGEYLRRLMLRVVRQYRPDRQRIVVFGQGGSGGMAYLLGFAGREVFSGIATSAAPLPRQLSVPESEPAQRLAIYAGLPAAEAASGGVSFDANKFTDAGYPLTRSTVLAADGTLSESERQELARWIDTLDRF